MAKCTGKISRTCMKEDSSLIVMIVDNVEKCFDYNGRSR